MGLLPYIQSIPKGYSTAIYRQKKYGVTRTNFNKGKSIKIFAQELGGTDFISFNYYSTVTSKSLRPCEMPSEKVIDFLLNFSLIKLK